jgi:hypothetical protein
MKSIKVIKQINTLTAVGVVCMLFTSTSFADSCGSDVSQVEYADIKGEKGGTITCVYNAGDSIPKPGKYRRPPSTGNWNYDASKGNGLKTTCIANEDGTGCDFFKLEKTNI